MATETFEAPAATKASERPRTVSPGRMARAAGSMRRRLPKLVFLRRLVNECIDDNITDLGAMMAYYAVLALFPMIVFIVTLSLLVIDPVTVHTGVLMVTSTLPESTRVLISDFTSKLIDGAGTGFAITSLVIALWGASRGTASLATALDAIFDCEERRPWWKRQVIAVAVTVAVALMAVLALALLVVGPVVGHYLVDRFGLGSAFDVVWSTGRWVGAGLLVMTVCAVVYKFLPDRRAPFRIFTTGSFVGVALWLGISFAFNVYLRRWGSYDKTYGALGGAIIFLTWLWLSNVALLVGAEINDVLTRLRKERAEAWLAHSTVSDLDEDHNR
ncbi:MAG TPA: YihY/virulence factor BrkB family protein [Kofleriaceae bacterium]